MNPTAPDTYAIPTFKRLWLEKSWHLAGCVAGALLLGVVGFIGFANMDFIFGGVPGHTGPAPTEPVTKGAFSVPAASRFVGAFACVLASSLILTHRTGRNLCRTALAEEQRQSRWAAADTVKVALGAAAALGAVIGGVTASHEQFDFFHALVPLAAGTAAAALPVGSWALAFAREACWPAGCDSLRLEVCLSQARQHLLSDDAYRIYPDSTWIGLWSTGLGADAITEMLERGFTPERIVESQHAGVPQGLSEGWL